MKKRDKQQAEPSGPYVGDKHGAIIVTRFRKIIKVTFWATFEHVKRPNKGPTARFKHFTLMTSWTFEVKNTISSGSFF
jgi:hypothetical protein